ncbi:MAG: serine/threonine-protein phosphatase, partial [Gammaproteobacteria bacterium]|nr:serine/threonine-protein phosphatase [Gammaproteobacteria bacterium]
VSGDFYDAYTLGDGRIAFCIADVAGKGMHAALLMAKTSSLFHCLGKSVHDPGKLLMMINREIVERTIHGMFVTMVAGVFDPESGEVVMANAGHLPVIRMAGREPVTEYAAQAPPLGIVPDSPFPCETFNLERDSLLMVTDGVLEARMGDNRRLERDGLLRLLVKHATKAPVERLQHIVGDVRRKATEIDDDMTLLLIESFA